MEKEIIEYILLIIVLSILILIYCFYVISIERKKIKYYKETISYDTDWDKYNHMVKVQRKIILRKKFKLFLLKILVFLRGVIKWK